MKTKPKSTSGQSRKSKPLTQKQAAHVVEAALLTAPITTGTTNPVVKEARERMQKALRQKLRVTKEDVAQGFLDAIADAKILADPATQIAGFRELGKMFGHYEPQKVSITVEGPVYQLREQLRDMNDTDLAELTGETLDGEFYEVQRVR